MLLKLESGEVSVICLTLAVIILARVWYKIYRELPPARDCSLA